MEGELSVVVREGLPAGLLIANAVQMDMDSKYGVAVSVPGRPKDDGIGLGGVWRFCRMAGSLCGNRT